MKSFVVLDAHGRYLTTREGAPRWSHGLDAIVWARRVNAAKRAMQVNGFVREVTGAKP